MKKKSVLYLLLVICSIGLFAACDKKDEGEPKEPVLPVEKELAGTYKGLLSILVNNQSLGDDAIQKIYISKSTFGDNLLKLELKNFSFGPMSLGDINVDSCVVTKKENVYAFNGNTILTLTEPIGTCPVTVTGTIENSKININISVAVAALGQDVVAKFAGSKMTGNESTEAKILTYTFDNNLITEQPAIDEDNGEITFKVIDSATDEDLKALVPTITISEKATITPESGVAQDFSNGKKVTYTVVSEDGTVKTYKVSVAGSQNVLKYTFEEWVTTDKGNYKYDEPKGLATSNAAAVLLEGILGGYYFPITKEVDNSAKIITMDTKGLDMWIAVVPAVTAGTLFTGSFKLNPTSPLKSTQFGISYDKKPLSFKVSYKYTPGPLFYETKITGDKYPKTVEKILVEGKIDECSINAYLYEVESDSETLDGTNINKSEKVIMKASLPDGTAKDAYTNITIPFEETENGTYDPSKQYKLAIVCSSSKEGDTYKGAPESTLWVNHLEVIGE